MTEEEKKEFEEFLLWKKEREKQKSEEPVNAPNSGTVEEKRQKSEEKSFHKKEEKNSSLGIVICLIVLLALGLLIGSQFKANPKKNTGPTGDVDSIADTTVIDSTQERIEQEVSEKAKQQAEIKRSYIKFTAAHLGKPNSAGGCDAYFHFKNTSNYTIKYLYIQCVIYNAVGDIISDELGRDCIRLEYTGPLKPGRSDGGNWDCVIYNYSAKRLVVTSLDIEYMNGTTIHYNEEEVKVLMKKKR